MPSAGACAAFVSPSPPSVVLCCGGRGRKGLEKSWENAQKEPIKCMLSSHTGVQRWADGTSVNRTFQFRMKHSQKRLRTELNFPVTFCFLGF